MTPQTIEENPTRSSSEIEQDIRNRRDKMDQTLDELGNRLSLRSMVNTVLEWWDDVPAGAQASATTRKALKGIARQVKHHPMPSLLIGGGITWLIADTFDEDDSSAHRNVLNRTERGSAALPGVSGSNAHTTDAIKGAISHAKEKASEYSESASEFGHRTLDLGKSSIRKLGREVVHGYQVGTESFTRAVDGNPLGVGLAFAALGALVGLSLPHSRREDKLMGAKSVKLLETAKEKGEQLVGIGMEIGGRVLDAVKEEAKDQGLAGSVAEIAEKSGKVVEKARAEVAPAVHESGDPKGQLVTSAV